MFLAINHDPLIEDKQTALQNFCMRVKMLKTDMECQEYLKEMCSFGKSEEPVKQEKDQQEADEAEDDGYNLDNISEASLDLSDFEAI